MAADYWVNDIQFCEAHTVPIQNAAPMPATKTMHATQLAPFAAAFGAARGAQVGSFAMSPP
jgi:hypothetical protein